MGFFDSIGGGVGAAVGGLTGGLAGSLAPAAYRAIRRGQGGITQAAKIYAQSTMLAPGLAAYGAVSGARSGKGAVAGTMGQFSELGTALTGKAGSLPPVVDPALDQQKLSDNAAAYRAARRRQMLAGSSAAGTSFTGPAGLGDSSGGTAKTLLGA